MSGRRPPGAVSCPGCGRETPGEARFCAECGHPLRPGATAACPACQEPNPSDSRFCHACGALLSAVAEAERRVITVLFADLSGFTTLTEQLDAERVRELVAACLDPLCDSVTRWGGHVDKFIGDCVMALFGAPVAHENEEERAIRAALDMQREMTRWSERTGDDEPREGYTPRLRIGINAGPVVTGVFSGGGATDYTAVGDTVNVAARLQSVCEPGGILVGSGAFEPAGHAFDFGDELTLEVRNRREPVRARYVRGAKTRRAPARGFHDRRIPLVGRDRELGQLRKAWSAVVERGERRIIRLVGPPGIGKSRLVEELASREDVGQDAVARGRSYPYARSTPWETVAEVLRELYDVSPSRQPGAAARKIAGAAGMTDGADASALAVALGSPASEMPGLDHLGPDERFARVTDVVLRTLGSIGEPRPRLLVFEDLHWADHATLAFLGGLAPQELPEPMLLVLVARPPVSGEDRLRILLDREGAHIDLPPLAPADSRELLERILEPHDVPPPLLRRIVDRAEGNPLFLEETVKTLSDRQLLFRDEDGRWRARDDVAELEVPDTIESVLSTRLDSLDPEAKRVIQYAAVVGRRFWQGVLAEALADRPVDEEIQRLLEGALVRSLPRSMIEDEREFAFEHLLMQEVAYRGLLRGLRSELHGAVARWLEEHLPETGGESAELIAYHYERSTEPELAVPYLERAASRARERGAVEDALALTARGLEAAAGDRDRFRLLLLREEILADQGEDEARAETVEELGSLAASIGDPVLRADAELRRARARLAEGDLELAREACRRSLDHLEEEPDASLEGDVHRLLGRLAHLWGDYPEARRRYERSLELERRAGDRQGEAEIMDRLGLVGIDTGDFTSALELFEEALAVFRELGHGPLEARTLAHRATALRWLGRLEEAAEAARGSLETALRCGSRRAKASAELTLGAVLADLGRPEEARGLLEHVRRAAVEMGRPRLAARAWLELAQLEVGERAHETAERAREAAGRSGLVHVEILALTRLAELALEAAEIDRADRLSEAGEEKLRRHGNIQGPEERVLHLRARVLAAAGRGEEAERLAHEARRVVEAKAGRIPDPDERRRYLETLPANRAILGGPPGASAPVTEITDA